MSTYSAAVLATSGLVSYWRLGEPSGTTAADSKGSNTGTYQASPTLGATGLLTGDADTAVSFNGTTQYISVPDAANLHLTGNFTLEAWVNPTDYTDYRMLVTKDNTFTPAPFEWRLDQTTGKPNLLLDAAFTSLLATTAPPAGSVSHIAITVSGTTWTHYLNGATNGTGTFGGVRTADGGLPVYIGARNDLSGTQKFKGPLDEVAVYNAALSTATILDHYQAGTLTGPYTPPHVGVRTVLPPLGLSVEVTLANGTRYRWDSGATSAGDRPQGISFRTKKGDGFADASVTLSRRIDQDYVDLNLYDDFTLVGYDGSIAYEGRVAANPRSLGDTHSMGVVLQGWMAHAKDRKFTEIYVDRDFGAWGDLPLNARVSLSASGWETSTWSGDSSGLAIAQEARSITKSRYQSWYTAPPGVTIAKFMYLGADTTFTSSTNNVEIIADDAFATGEAYALTLDSTLRSPTITTPRRYVVLDSTYSGGATTPTVGATRRISVIGVYGNHGLTTRTIDSTTPDGLYASDVMTNIVSRFCPRLNTTGIQATSYAIPHLTFKDAIAPYDAFLDLNKYHLWSLAVYENKTLFFEPFDYTDYDWEVRLSDPGVTTDLQGDSADDLYNGICVNYTDVATGKPNRLTPTDDTTLADTSINNPVNTHGLTRWAEFSLSSPTTSTAAAQIGRAALAEFNQAKAPGTIHVTGHIRDRAGHWQPAWKVRYGDRLIISDHPNDSVRLVAETDYSHDSKTVSIAVDSSFMRLDAALDRVSTALQAANLT